MICYSLGDCNTRVGCVSNSTFVGWGTGVGGVSKINETLLSFCALNLMNTIFEK